MKWLCCQVSSPALYTCPTTVRRPSLHPRAYHVSPFGCSTVDRMRASERERERQEERERERVCAREREWESVREKESERERVSE